MTLLPSPALGEYLRDRRARLDPAACGFRPGRRRTPGLRREEVAQRAGVSVTWYTWLEQGRGGLPSTAALEGIATALALDEAAREHLFLLAQGAAAAPQVRSPGEVAPEVLRVLDALAGCPAYVKTAAWTILAWNAAAAAVLTDYGRLPPDRRNILRLLFGDAGVRDSLPDWERDARFALAAYRAETARVGECPEAAALVAELARDSADFRRLWAERDVRSHGGGLKRIVHRTAGPLTLSYAAFAIDGSEGLGLVVYTPASEADASAVRALVTARETSSCEAAGREMAAREVAGREAADGAARRAAA